MFKLSLLAFASYAFVGSEASWFRPSFQKRKFDFVHDPNWSKPCGPGCYNAVKDGYNVTGLPMTIDQNVDIEFQDEHRRPSPAAADMKITVKTQVGCAVSGVASTNLFGWFPREEVVQLKVATDNDLLPDGTAQFRFGGLVYETIPAGKCSIRFETKNYDTRDNTCTFEIIEGYKHWILG